jgi:hypothetical protein
MENNHNFENQEPDIQENFNREDAYIRAKKRLEKLKGFYWHLAAYLGVNIFIVSMVWSNLEEGESLWRFEAFATPIFWGIGLFFHFLGVFARNLIFSKDWEDRKIKNYMDRDKKYWE